VTVAGTVTAALLELSETTVPPAGAITASWTKPLLEVPPMTVAGVKLNDSALAALIVKEPEVVAPLRVAVIVAVVSVPTAALVAVKLTLVAPEGTVTDEGTVALVVEDERAIGRPAAGAGVPIVSVPSVVEAPVTEVGLKVSETKPDEEIVSTALADWPLADAPIVLVAWAPTATVVTANVALVAPAGTTTFVGTVAAEVLLEVRGTVRPPVGAGLLMLTVPLEGDPPATEVGLSVRPLTNGAVTVNVPVADVELPVAVIVTEVFVATADVAKAMVPLVAPAAIIKVPGAVAAAELEVNVTG
jgi:hypothetical protein